MYVDEFDVPSSKIPRRPYLKKNCAPQVSFYKTGKKRVFRHFLDNFDQKNCVFPQKLVLLAPDASLEVAQPKIDIVKLYQNFSKSRSFGKNIGNQN